MFVTYTVYLIFKLCENSDGRFVKGGAANMPFYFLSDAH